MDQFARRPPNGAPDAPEHDARPSDDRDLIDVSPAQDEASEGSGGADKPAMPSRWVFVGVAVVLVALLAWGAYGHWKTSQAAADVQQQEADLVPSVRVVKAQTESGPTDVTLPGETQPYTVSNIYARATGYIAERKVDIGSRVKKGDLLVRIAAPDLDQQLAQAIAQLGQVKAALLQAQANVTQAEANLNLAKVNLQRAQALVGQGFETLQNRDQLQANQIAQAANLDSAQAGVKVAVANVDAQQAGIDRLKALAAFENVRAPFDGIVTARNFDVGDLVNADSSSGTALFALQEDDVLRVYVQVPQDAAVGIRNGLEARITVPQLPGKTFVGLVSRSAVALQSSARTLQVEVDIPNQSATLRAGLYAYVSLAVPRTHSDVTLPAETLIFDQHGTHVAVVRDGTVSMVEIHIARDVGTTLDIDQGPNGGDEVILSPPTILRDGSKVKIEDEGGGDKPAETAANAPKEGKSQD